VVHLARHDPEEVHLVAAGMTGGALLRVVDDVRLVVRGARRVRPRDVDDLPRRMADGLGVDVDARAKGDPALVEAFAYRRP
jgi:hypothetical protein